MRRALGEILAVVHPAALPLPTEWDGPFETFESARRPPGTTGHSATTAQEDAS